MNAQSPDGAPQDERTAELAARLERVHQRIEDASRRAAREKPELIVVTKFHPAEDVRRLYSLGVREVGENRDQEASAKASELVDLEGLSWHFIGQLQSNKARSVVRYASAVHSVDRDSIATALSRAVLGERENGGRADLDVLLQVNLDPAAEEQTRRGGALPASLPALADHVAVLEGLRLRGLMAVAPLGADPRPAFEWLHRLSGELQAAHPEATLLSAGMSHDLEDAIACGATHLRIGTDVLGPRPPMG
ncbi:YggS family pyridoxal phosphate-dependent enzyme [Arthrobacter woluwensis]|uniref:YggS family pyridoxal phosphate-dependent enzyme n=1 Tax=Arthrobacter woluwensis TaxID=156980 RepID=UPI001AAE4DF4|nr:YggS family pyridoxal phosphate-dependent enzyme [Arthrobacter woluwensis]QTF71228.1 YggS family pyridoxal phosphate-dependent enzyme [Arthrobacter woluwensis]